MKPLFRYNHRLGRWRLVPMNTLCERLREERLRLKMSQEAFGAAGGVGKLTQLKYEKGERRPDARYLERIAAVGANVNYILTGTTTSDCVREAA